MFYEEGDEDDVDLRRRRRRDVEEESNAAEELDNDIPIDVLENTRGRTPRDHVSDEAVGREIERRWGRLEKNKFNQFILKKPR